MSRRRRRRPNLPQDTLSRARQQAGLDDAPPASPPTESGVAPRRREAVRPSPAPRRSRSLRATEELTQDEIAERLARPVRQVSEEQLRAQYAYVVADLRSMGLLALGLFVLMILAALLL